MWKTQTIAIPLTPYLENGVKYIVDFSHIHISVQHHFDTSGRFHIVKLVLACTKIQESVFTENFSSQRKPWQIIETDFKYVTRVQKKRAENFWGFIYYWAFWFFVLHSITIDTVKFWPFQIDFQNFITDQNRF